VSKGNKLVILLCGGVLIVWISSTHPLDAFRHWEARREATRAECLMINSRSEAMGATVGQGQHMRVVLSAESIARLAESDCHLTGDDDEALRQSAQAIVWAEEPAT
jgi:hypothetical protein